jgi:ligand-binding sensor domain-containing protein
MAACGWAWARDWPAGGHPECFKVPRREGRSGDFPVQDLSADASNGLWVNTGPSGVWHFASGRWESHPEFANPRAGNDATVVTRDGSRWFGVGTQGLARERGERLEFIGRADGLSGESVRKVFEDREGNIWVATSGGLDRLRDIKVATLTPREGLALELTRFVTTARDGSVWLSGETRLVNWRDGSATVYEAGKAFKPDFVDAILEDTRGRLWIGAGTRLLYFEDGRFHEPDSLRLKSGPSGPGIMRMRSMALDNDGSLRRSCRRAPGTSRSITPPSASPSPSMSVSAIGWRARMRTGARRAPGARPSSRTWLQAITASRWSPRSATAPGAPSPRRFGS